MSVRKRSATAARIACLLTTAWLVSGCGSSSEDLVRRAAEEFVSAAASGNSTRACDLLTEEARDNTDCAALNVAGGPVRQVEVWGDAARVHTADDVLFLRELAAGWRISGAGCEPRGDRPHKCEVGGP